MRERVYLSGPMTGYPEFNRAAFEIQSAWLRGSGRYDEVVDPITEDLRVYGSWELAKAADWKEHLARDVALVPTCQVIALMEGWEKSNGARLELEVALGFNLEVQLVLTSPGPSWAPFSLYTLTPREALARLREAQRAAELTDAVEVRVIQQGTLVSEEDYQLYDATGRFVPYDENPLRHTFETGGIKDNRGKAPIDLLPSKPLVAIAKILEFGARKYKPHNWRHGLPWADTYSSLQRHLLYWNDGEDLDPETGESHLAHAGCQLLFLLEYVLTGQGRETDNRFRLVQPEDRLDQMIAAIDSDGHDPVAHPTPEGA